MGVNINDNCEKKQKFGGRIKIYLELKCMTKIIQGAEKHELKYFKVLQF